MVVAEQLEQRLPRVGVSTNGRHSVETPYYQRFPIIDPHGSRNIGQAGLLCRLVDEGRRGVIASATIVE
jgi:hypothetical protein